MTDFPLCRECGLEVILRRDYPNTIAHDYVRAADVEALLQSAPVVYGIPDCEYDRTWCKEPDCSETHTALLVNVRPIVRDTAESLLRELVRELDTDKPNIYAIVRRAHDLLGGDK